MWDAVLWEAHGTDARSLFPLADPARLVAATRTLRTPTRDQITGAYDLTCQEFSDRTPERPARHWAERLFLLHTNIVDHLPGAPSATAVLTELHARFTEAPAGTATALDVVTALRERLDAGPAAARDIPCRSDEILIRALELATFQGCSLTNTGGNRTAVVVPLADDWTIRIDDQGSANHPEEIHGTGKGSAGWTAHLHDPDGDATDVLRHPSPDTAHECLADSAACVRQLTQWRAESQAKGPVQNCPLPAHHTEDSPTALLTRGLPQCPPQPPHWRRRTCQRSPTVSRHGSPPGAVRCPCAGTPASRTSSGPPCAPATAATAPPC